jgi:hypothetical protein
MRQPSGNPARVAAGASQADRHLVPAAMVNTQGPDLLEPGASVHFFLSAQTRERSCCLS